MWSSDLQWSLELDARLLHLRLIPDDDGRLRLRLGGTRGLPSCSPLVTGCGEASEMTSGLALAHISHLWPWCSVADLLPLKMFSDLLSILSLEI